MEKEKETEMSSNASPPSLPSKAMDPLQVRLPMDHLPISE